MIFNVNFPKMYIIKNILVPLDFSQMTNQLLDVATGIAKSTQAKLWLVHVAAPDPEFVGYKVGPEHERAWRAETLRNENLKMRDISSSIKNELGLEVSNLLLQGEVVSKILEQSTKLESDVIIMGTHGHGVLASSILGSVSKEVIRKSSVPVLLVPVKE